MKKWFVFLMFVSQVSLGARIIDAYWDPQSQVIVVELAYQGGCQPHNFHVQWDGCMTDMGETTPEVSRFGNILDSGWQDTCGEEQHQIVVFEEPSDTCNSDVVILKSTSDKTPHVIIK